MTQPDDRSDRDGTRRRGAILPGRCVVVAVVAFLLGLALGLLLCGDDSSEAAAPTAPVTTPTTDATTSSEPAETSAGSASDPTTTTLTTEVPGLDLTGSWMFTITVTNEEGVCDDELGEPYDSDVIVEQTGTALSLVGLGDEGEAWIGAIDGARVVFSGDRGEDGGVTTASFSLEVDPLGTTLVGTEEWVWEGPSGTCPNGLSHVAATRG